jgi:threonine dehydrogenase-like Zn-dependent dehydrogenase
MRAVVFEDTRQVGVHDVEVAVLEGPTDVVVRVTSSAICGTDLHMFDGRTGAMARPGQIVTPGGSLDDAPSLYDSFDRRANGVVKAILRPN